MSIDARQTTNAQQQRRALVDGQQQQRRALVDGQQQQRRSSSIYFLVVSRKYDRCSVD
jgi:hypothetical protein